MIEHQTHPFRPYLPDKAEGIIIGSAPPDQFCTGTLHVLREGEINFFYGSLMNQFWYIIKHVLEPDNLKWPKTKKHCMDILKFHRLGIGDILYSFDRKDKSSADNDLSNLTYNSDLITSIMRRDNVRYLFFTSKYAYKHFCAAVESMGYTYDNDQFQNHSSFSIFIRKSEVNKNFCVYILKSPSPRGNSNIATLTKDYQEGFSYIAQKQ